jgi:hypothetical protein
LFRHCRSHPASVPVYVHEPADPSRHFDRLEHAEGSRRPTKAYINHLSYSLGSHGELETLFELIHRRKLVPEPLLMKGIRLAEPVGKMLHGLVESLEARAQA